MQTRINNWRTVQMYGMMMSCVLLLGSMQLGMFMPWPKLIAKMIFGMAWAGFMALVVMRPILHMLRDALHKLEELEQDNLMHRELNKYLFTLTVCVILWMLVEGRKVAIAGSLIDNKLAVNAGIVGLTIILMRIWDYKKGKTKLHPTETVVGLGMAVGGGMLVATLLQGNLLNELFPFFVNFLVGFFLGGLIAIRGILPSERFGRLKSRFVPVVTS